MSVPVYEAVRIKREGAPNGHSFGLYHYDVVAMCWCDECGREFIDVFNTDPGSTEEAIGVRDMCSECWAKPDVEPFLP